ECLAELVDVDAADADRADLAFGPQRNHLGQLAVEVDTRRSITRESEVHHVDPLHAEASQVGLDPGSQLVGPLRGDPSALAVTIGADLCNQHQVIWVGVKRGADELVGDVGTVVLGRVDVVYAELNGPAQDGEGHGPIAWRSQHARTRQLQGAVADSGDGAPGQRRGAAWLLLSTQLCTPSVDLVPAKVAN